MTALARQDTFDAAVQLALTEFAALPNNPIYYRELTRAFDTDQASEANAGVIFAQPVNAITDEPYPGVVDWLIALRSGGTWRFSFPGDTNYREMLRQLSESFVDSLDAIDLELRPPASEIIPLSERMAYILPLEIGTFATVTRSFTHHGIGKLDLDVNGAAITAAKDGVIVFAIDSHTRSTYEALGWWYWNVVIIRHAENEYSLYGHLAPNSIPDAIISACEPDGRCNVPIRAGDVIGLEGNTGNSTNPHLHMEFGQAFGVIPYLDRLDEDGDGDRSEVIYAGYVYLEHNVGMSGYTPSQVAAWNYGDVIQATGGNTPPDNVNLIRNGDFSAGTADWIAVGQLNWEVVDGVMHATRLNTAAAPDYARFYQSINAPIAANMVFQVTFQLGNNSGISKQVTVTLLNGAGRQYGALSCTFDLPAGAPLAPYALAARVPDSWLGLTLSFGINPPDGSPAALIDDIDVRYQPDSAVTDIECRFP